MLIRELEKEIITLRVQNRYAALQLQNIQDEIEYFSAQYYSAIEDICIAIANIESKISQYKQKIANLKMVAFADTGYDIQPRENLAQKQAEEKPAPISLERELKELYRNLIKLVHPDVSEEKLQAAEYTMMVNKAYNERNYRQLVELDQLIRSGQATEHELKQQRNKLIDSTFELKLQREDLLENPIYALSKQFSESDDGGIEMMKTVRAKLSEHAEERKRELMDLKLTYLEKVAELIGEKV